MWDQESGVFLAVKRDTLEKILSAEDAQLRLRQIAAETTPDIVVEYTQLGGWPALVRTFSDVMPKIGQEDRTAGIVPRVWRTTVALAAGPVLVRVEGTLVSDQEAAARAVLTIARSIAFVAPGVPAASERAVEHR